MYETSEISQRYHDIITDLYGEYNIDIGPSVEERRKICDELVEEYFEETGERPPHAILSRLSTYLLLDTLRDKHPDKMTRDEYPIASYYQVRRRYAKMRQLFDVPYSTDDVSGRDSKGDIFLSDTPEQRAQLWDVFLKDVLTEREHYIIKNIYSGGMRLVDLADEMEISRQRVGYLRDRSLRKISEALQEVDG